MKEKKLPNKRKIAAILVLCAIVAVIAWSLGQSDNADTFDTDISLNDGLKISCIGKYSGAYVEDGSNEDVDDVMMIVVENQSEQDLQLARINMIYAEFTAQFEVTNLPAGSSAMLLEKNRHSAVDDEYTSVETKNVVFFPEPMSLQEDKISIQGLDGALNVENISDTDITGNIYIYYKNNRKDGFLGGITYRARVEDGLAAGEMAQLSTGHYSPETSTILMVTCGE